VAGLHEFRYPIHTFVRVDDDERRVVDTPPVQRLRQIHQLAMTYLVYPGATHRRFEHSLGVMELAGRVFDVVTRTDNIHPDLPDALKSWMADRTKLEARKYWRRVLRMAALCHDIGHLPFSHVAEGTLLPADFPSHERYTAALIQS
jgi:HD superfamily phosphohydrolase